MKNLILSAAFVAMAGLATTTVKANDFKTSLTTITTQADTTKTPVKLEDLPDPVKETLKSDKVKEWTATEAFLVKEGEAEYYLIHVRKEEQTGSLKIDKDGKVIE